MRKNSTRGYLILALVFVLVSVVVFAVPEGRTSAFWIAYVFTVVAFAAQIGIWKVAFAHEGALKSKFLGLPVVHIGIVYLLVQIIALVVFSVVSTLPAWSAVIACVVITVVSALCMIAADVGRDEIERVNTAAQKKVFYIRALQAEVELLAEKEPDSATKTALLQLAEKIRFSDPMSSEQLADLENKISTKVAELKTAPSKLEIITELNSLLGERNEKCKILK